MEPASITRVPRRRWVLLAAVLAGGVLAVSVALLVLLPDGGPQAALVDAGDPDRFEIGDPVHFQDEGFWLIRMDGDIFIALLDEEPLASDSGRECKVEWAEITTLVAGGGLFKGECSGSLFDLSGAVFFGPAPRGIDRFPARIEEGRVRVDVGTRICGNGLPAESADCLFPRPLQ